MPTYVIVVEADSIEDIYERKGLWDIQDLHETVSEEEAVDQGADFDVFCTEVHFMKKVP